jgi:hypothetical protein
MFDYKFPKALVNLDKLSVELSSLSLVGCSFSSGEVTLHSSVELTPEQLTLAQTVIDSHVHISAEQAVFQIVSNAIAFGNDLIVRFAAENVLMGVTQAGKTKAVADYLVDVMRYAQTGSLYEVINEVSRLQSLGVPSGLSPFVTEQRLEQFKQKIITYLQG